MTKRIRLKLGNETAVATLLEEDSPQICSALWNALPMKVPAFHAKICNHEIIAPTPLIGIGRDKIGWPKAGDVGWWDVRNSLNIWYDDPGPSGPLSQSAVMAKVTQNLKGLRKEGLKLWKKQGTRLEISRMEE